MSDLLGPLGVLRTQRGTLVRQKSCQTHQQEVNILRFWGRRWELTAGDWGAQELEVTLELSTLASVLRPWRRQEPVLVPKLSSHRRPQNLKYSLPAGVFPLILVEEWPSLGSKPVSMPKVATRRPTAVHTSPASCKLRSRAWGLGLAVGPGLPIGTKNLQLPLWGQANGPSSGDVHGRAARIQARLD